MERKEINPWEWQEKFGFVHAVDLVGSKRMVFVAGQVSVAADGKPCFPNDMAAQIDQTFNNLETVLMQANTRLTDVVRLVYYTTNIDLLLEHWPRITQRLADGACRPVSSLLGVNRLSSPIFLIEIEATVAVS